MEMFKFRCWDKVSQQIVYPDKLTHNINSGLSVATVFDPNKGFLIPVVSDNVVLMQCTGSKDSDGKDIFEGDKVKVYNDIHDLGVYTVVFRCMGFWFVDEENEGFVFTTSSYHLKVIGHIYETN